MKVVIDNKQVWPPLGRKGTHGYRFKKETDGSLVYTEVALNAKGQPASNRPLVIVEMSQAESETLAVELSKDTKTGDRRTREDLERALSNLDEIRKKSEHPETK